MRTITDGVGDSDSDRDIALKREAMLAEIIRVRPKKLRTREGAMKDHSESIR